MNGCTNNSHIGWIGEFVLCRMHLQFLRRFEKRASVFVNVLKLRVLVQLFEGTKSPVKSLISVLLGYIIIWLPEILSCMVFIGYQCSDNKFSSCTSWVNYYYIYLFSVELLCFIRTECSHHS